MSKTIRIATRQSALALWQAEHVATRLRAEHADLQVELVGMTTRGDQLIDTPLATLGGKGLFIKELERAMLDGRADIAVHSMKDVPAEFPPGLQLAVILDREDPRDAFVSNHFAGLDEMPEGARIGTCSLRRQCQLAARYPQLEMVNLRGNVNTRLRKLDDGEYDAIILAVAGLLRLGFNQRIRAPLAPEHCLPAAAQGAIGIECRADDPKALAWLQPLADAQTTTRITAERAFNARLGGSCQVPIAGFAELDAAATTLHLRGLVGLPDGSRIISGERHGPAATPEALGLALAEQLLEQGADEVLRASGAGSAH